MYIVKEVPTDPGAPANKDGWKKEKSWKLKLLGGLGSLDGLDQLGNDLEQVAHDTVVSHL